MKKFIKIIVYTISIAIGVIVLYFLSAIILSRISVHSDKSNLTEIPIYIYTNGMHTDFVFPVKTDEIN